ncbi:RNA-guided endonuclease InsQ/TnpB family protein [Alteromonas facilis]|uniref:RNA-guided endonuclease InsQ/TnpB family protein n=1 Tax=Alteromonas facilis TaxID=2048004 RepID=UPI000C294768|nr:RNA-guided endonuclease TnpB family protein [Alteromonas facilis]
MITGIKFQAKPTLEQVKTLRQWQGCQRFIWNAKCDEDLYLRTFAKKYLPVGTYAEPNQSYSQYKDKALSPWLYDCPSQILRNGTTNWYNTYRKFIKGVCGRPKHKRASNQGSVHLTKELFKLFKEDNRWVLEIGTKSKPLGILNVKFHRSFEIPKSIYIKRNHDRWSVSFCYEDGVLNDYLREDHFKHLKGETREQLESKVIGIDRGIKRPVQFGEKEINYTPEQIKKMCGHERHIKQLQRNLARQQKGSKRYSKTSARIARKKSQQSNIRHDFAHKASHQMVSSNKSVLVFENLKTKNMSRSAKGSAEQHGKNVKQKSGLNRGILEVGWHIIQSFTEYKAEKAGKAVFYISPYKTSQECANCGHTHADNRKSQSLFKCTLCEYTDNADNNASAVIKKRAINLILDSGTELSDKGLLKPSSDIGREFGNKTQSKPAIVRAKKRQKRQLSFAA